MENANPESLRKFSKTLLGNRYRLEISLAIARQPNGQVSARGLSRELGLSDSLVQPEVKRLAELGLLRRLPRHGVERVYERRPFNYWSAIVGLHDDAVAAFRDRR